MEYCAVLIPCYNEETTIRKVVRDWKNEIPEATIYVYDNNSTDNTALIAREEGAVVRQERKQGKGNVIRRMFREVDAQCYIMVDGDDTYPVEYGRQMMNEILSKKADMVVGDRLSSTYFNENKRKFHNFGNILVTSTINHLFKSDIRDIMTGYRAFSFPFVKTFPVLSKGFEIETEMSIHAVDKNMQISSIMVAYRDRPRGSESKLNTYGDGMKVLKTIGVLYKDYKPMHFFSGLSLLLFLTAVLLFLPVFVTYVQTGMVPRMPTLIVAVFLAMAALLSFFSGMILDTFAKKNRQEFEALLSFYEMKYKELLQETQFVSA